MAEPLAPLKRKDAAESSLHHRLAKKQRRIKSRQAKSEDVVASQVQAQRPEGGIHQTASVEGKKLKSMLRKIRRRVDEKKPTRSDISDSGYASTPKATIGSPAEWSSQSSAVLGLESEQADRRSVDYVEHADLSRIAQSEVDRFITSNCIKIVDRSPTGVSYRPILAFPHLPNYDIHQTIFASFSSPTPIQSATWPYLFARRDVVGVAETGSGKTLAFGVPCISRLSSLPPKDRKHVCAVVVSPTRELACQIYEQLALLANQVGLKVACVYGGVPKDDQRVAVKRAQIVVATPGRLNDLLSEGAVDLSAAQYVCLDEADRMLDRGFEDDIKKILQSVAPGPERQTVMFTATWPMSVRELAGTFMKSPVQVYIGNNPNGDLRANDRIEQLVEVMDPKNKDFRLVQLLREHQKGSKKSRVLVFCLYKKEATRVENNLRMKGFNVAGIHGDLSQAKRTASLQSFKTGEVPILVATDVAARGLDIPAVRLVVNVTFPLTAEDYVHRIGRAGEKGKAITFFTEHDKHLSGSLINVLKAAKQPVPEALLRFGSTVKKKTHDVYGAFYKEIDETKKATKITFDD